MNLRILNLKGILRDLNLVDFYGSYTERNKVNDLFNMCRQGTCIWEIVSHRILKTQD
jgi:hypothetical protein